VALVAGAVLLALMPVAAGAAAPSESQKAQFVNECLRVSGGNSTLCSCKAEQAMKLIDADFMAVVLRTMNGATLPVDQSKRYAVYISKSNAVCAPGM
jgi:hypothetical protein